MTIWEIWMGSRSLRFLIASLTRCTTVIGFRSDSFGKPDEQQEPTTTGIVASANHRVRARFMGADPL
jgi:hypothetical protein